MNFNLDKLYNLSNIQEEKKITIDDKDIITTLEKSYYNELLKANEEYIELQKKQFRNFYNLDKTEEKVFYKEIIKVLLGKKVKVKHMDQWFNKINDKVLSLLLKYNKDSVFRYNVISKYLKKDKYSDYSRIKIYIPEDIYLFNIDDKDIERYIKNGKLYKQLESIVDLTDIDTWKNNPTPKNRIFSKKLIPSYIFGSHQEIDTAMNKTHCIKISNGSYKAKDLIITIDNYYKSKKRMIRLLISLIKDIKDQIALFKSDSEHYMKSFPEQYKLTKYALDDIDYIMDSIYYIYRRFIKQIHDTDQIFSVTIDEMYDRLIKYRDRENNTLGKSYIDNKHSMEIDKRIG